MELKTNSLTFVLFGTMVFILSFSACTTISKIQFQALEAPQIVLPADINRIAFVDRNQYFPSDSVTQYYSMTGVVMKDTIDHTSGMTLNCYEGFRENISEYLQQDSIPFVCLPRKIMPDTIRKSPPMVWSRVDSICKATESDVLVVLEKIQAFYKHDIVKGDSFWALTEVNYLGLWRIYDPAYQKIYDSRLLVDSLFMETEASTYDRLVYKKLPSRQQILNDASYELGKSYVDLISPKWEDISRDYFAGGDKRLSAALYFVGKTEFNKAIGIWEGLTKGEDMKLAGRAAFNLAVVHEMHGELNKAKHWIRNSMFFYKKLKKLPAEYKQVEAYYHTLNVRWVNDSLIKQFFGEDLKGEKG